MNCYTCGRSMVDPRTGTQMTGFLFQVHQPADGFYRIYPELKDIESAGVCYVCWLRALGFNIP